MVAAATRLLALFGRLVAGVGCAAGGTAAGGDAGVTVTAVCGACTSCNFWLAVRAVKKPPKTAPAMKTQTNAKMTLPGLPMLSRRDRGPRPGRRRRRPFH